MPPKFTADALNTDYGDELARPPLSDTKTPRMLRKALLERNPPLDVSDGIFCWGITHSIFFRDNTQYGVYENCRTAKYPSHAMHPMNTGRTAEHGIVKGASARYSGAGGAVCARVQWYPQDVVPKISSPARRRSYPKCRRS